MINAAGAIRPRPRCLHPSTARRTRSHNVPGHHNCYGVRFTMTCPGPDGSRVRSHDRRVQPSRNHSSNLIKSLLHSPVREDRAEDRLPDRLLETIRSLRRRLDAERTLSAGKLGILHHLTEVPRATAGELARRLRVSPQAISLAARELEALGLILRNQDDEDRRRVWFALAPSGRARYWEENSAALTWLSGALDERLTPAEVHALAAALPVLAKLVDEGADD
jgi:DNA-binding MarR family transcriptional regulator